MAHISLHVQYSRHLHNENMHKRLERVQLNTNKTICEFYSDESGYYRHKHASKVISRSAAWFCMKSHQYYSSLNAHHCPTLTNNNFPPCPVGLPQPQPEEESPLSCHAPLGLQNGEDNLHPACTWWWVWCCVCECTVPCIFVYCMCMGVWLCVMSISVCIHVCQCLLNGGYKSTSILTCISNQTNTKQDSYSFDNC